MSIIVNYSTQSLTAEQYDAFLARERELGVKPVEGLELELCFGSGDQMKVTIVYDSMEALERHQIAVAPIFEEMKMERSQPEVVKTHNVIRRGE